VDQVEVVVQVAQIQAVLAYQDREMLVAHHLLMPINIPPQVEVVQVQLA